MIENVRSLFGEVEEFDKEFVRSIQRYSIEKAVRNLLDVFRGIRLS